MCLVRYEMMIWPNGYVVWIVTRQRYDEFNKRNTQRAISSILSLVKSCSTSGLSGFFFWDFRSMCLLLFENILYGLIVEELKRLIKGWRHQLWWVNLFVLRFCFISHLWLTLPLFESCFVMRSIRLKLLSCFGNRFWRWLGTCMWVLALYLTYCPLYRYGW